MSPLKTYIFTEKIIRKTHIHASNLEEAVSFFERGGHVKKEETVEDITVGEVPKISEVKR